MDLPYLKYSIYKNCPLQYRWRFIEKPPVLVTFDNRYTYLGFLLQRLVENFYLEGWWKSDSPITKMRQMLPVYSQNLLESQKFNLTDKDILDWNGVAHEALPLIIKTIKRERLLSPEVYVEREDEIPFESTGDNLQGKPDLVIVRDDVITLLDGKGGKTVGRYIDKDQLYYYSYILSKAWLKRLPHRIGFWWFRHDEIQWLKISHEEIETLLVKVRAVLAGIKEQNYQPTPGQHCRLCDYRVCCEAGQRFIASRHRVCDADIPTSNIGEVDF